MTEAAADAILAFFEKFWGLEQEPTVEVLMQERLETGMYRNAAAIAKLLGAEEVGASHALGAIELFTQCLSSLGIRTEDAPSAMSVEPTRPGAYRQMVLMLTELNPEGFLADDLVTMMANNAPHLFPTRAAAQEYHDKHKVQNVHAKWGDARLTAI